MRLLSPRPQADQIDDAPQPSFLTELLFPLPAHRRTIVGIVTWWESRRLLYNIIVGTTGLVTLTVVTIANLLGPTRNVPTGFSPDSLIPILVYGVLANVCYTLGAIIELTLERVWKDTLLPIGPALFRQGLAFSIGLTLLPIPIVIAFEMVRLATRLFLRW